MYLYVIHVTKVSLYIWHMQHCRMHLEKNMRGGDDLGSQNLKKWKHDSYNGDLKVTSFSHSIIGWCLTFPFILEFIFLRAVFSTLKKKKSGLYIGHVQKRPRKLFFQYVRVACIQCNAYHMYKLYMPQVGEHVICIVYMPRVTCIHTGSITYRGPFCKCPM